MGSRYYTVVCKKKRKSFLFLFVTNTFEMQIILCNILKGWGQTTKYIRWPWRIKTTTTIEQLFLFKEYEYIMGSTFAPIVILIWIYFQVLHLELLHFWLLYFTTWYIHFKIKLSINKQRWNDKFWMHCHLKYLKKCKL